MNYRLIAVDMDGTLLDDSKSITPRTEAAVKLAGEAQVSVCLCTGRPLCGVQKFIRQLSLRTPVITCNGALIADAGSGEILFSRCMEPQDARAVWEFGQRFDTTICVWVGDRLFVNILNERTEDYKKISGIEPEIVTDFDCLVRKGISKMLWYDTSENIKEFRRRLDTELSGSVTRLTSNPAFLEFFDSRVSKARAMEFIGEYLGIAREQMIAVGDGENDLSMLEYAGLGVAMGNASGPVKSRCGHITSTNNEDGVAEVIERFCLSDHGAQ